MSYEELAENHQWVEWGPGGLMGVTQFWRQDCLDSAREFLREHGYRELVLDCAAAARDGVHETIRSALDLPSWFGSNWNAYFEAFQGGFGIEPGERIAFVLINADALDSETVHDLIEGAAMYERDFLYEGGRLAVLVQTADPAAEVAPVGARGVRWNPREWLTANRGTGSAS